MKTTETKKTKKNNALVVGIWAIAIGVFCFLLILAWITTQTLELLGKVSIIQDPWLQYIYYALFILTSITTPAWIATLVLTYIRVSERSIRIKKYKTSVITISVLLVVLLIAGSIFSVIWAGQPAEGLYHWSAYVSNTLWIIDFLVAIFGIVVSIIGLNKIKNRGK